MARRIAATALETMRSAPSCPSSAVEARASPVVPSPAAGGMAMRSARTRCGSTASISEVSAAPACLPLLRIVLNAKADLADDAMLLNTLDQAPLLVVHHPDADTARLRAWGVDLLAVADPHDLAAVARSLGALGLNDILVEGGAAIHGAFLRARLYDRLEIYQGGTTLAGGLPVCRGPGAPTIPDGQHWLPECPPMVLGHTILTRWRLPQ